MIVSLLDVLQWSGCAFGVAGSFLLARKNQHSKYGWVSYVISNALWIAYGIETRAWGLVTQQVAFTYTSALGIYFWIIQPAKVAAVKS